jgi:hypothetical protein
MPGATGDVTIFTQRVGQAYYRTGVRGTDSIIWQGAPTAFAATDTTPSSVVLGAPVNLIAVARKKPGAGSQPISVYTFDTAPVDAQILHAAAQTPDAPSAVWAAGRMWVFFRSANGNLYYTSNADPRSSEGWLEPRFFDDIITDAAPEAIFYQVHEGALGESGRIWVYHRRPQGGPWDPPAGTYVFSVVPQSNGDLGSTPPDSPLPQVRVGIAPYAYPFFSAAQWGNWLRLIHPSTAGPQVNGVDALYRMNKLGDG